MAQHMMAAIDEDGAQQIVSSFVSGLSDSISDSALGFSYNIQWVFVPGNFELVDAGDIIRLREWDIQTNISFGWSYDLSNIIHDFCLPRICIPTPFGRICTPSICIDWPTINLSVNLPTIVSEVSVDFSLQVEYNTGVGEWVLRGLVNPFTLDIDIVDLADTARINFENTLGNVLEEIPYIGPFISDVISWISSNVLDLIDDLMETVQTILSDSLGLHPVFAIGFDLHRVNEIFEILPSAGPEQAVMVRITELDAEITSDKELVISVDIAVP